MQIKTLHIEYTTACNSRCVMCDYWKTGAASTIDPTLVLTSITECYPHGLKTVYFTGGECLMFAEKLFSLCGQIKKMYPDIKLGIITNGLLLERYYKDVATFFSKVIISLDSTDPDVYKTIRGVDGFQTIKNGIRLLRSFSFETIINLRVLVLEENTHNLLDIIEFGINEKINRISFIPEDTNSEKAFGRTEDVFSKKEKLYSYLPELRDAIQEIRGTYSQHLGKMLRPALEDLERVYMLYAGATTNYPLCDKPYQSCVIATSGTVSPCFFINGSQQITKNKTLNEVLESEEYCSHIADIAARNHPACLKCACPKELS